MDTWYLRLRLLKFFLRCLASTPIPSDPYQVLQGSFSPLELSFSHLLLFHLCRHPGLLKREQKCIISVYTGESLLSQVCRLCGTSNSHTLLGENFECSTAASACRLCIVECSASSLCSCGAHFSLLFSALFQTSLHIAPADKTPERPAR